MAPVRINNALRATTALWEMCAFGCKDGKVSAGEMRPQAGGDVRTGAIRVGMRRRGEETQDHESSLTQAPNSLGRWQRLSHR